MADPQGNQIAEEKTAPAIPTENKPAEAQDDLTLPDGVSERTAEQFDKLKQRLHEAELKLKSQDQPKGNSVFDDLRPPVPVQVETPNLSETQVTEIKNRFTDDNGFVDVARLEAALTDAENRAKNAEAKVQQVENRVQRFEESTQVREVHTVYPTLDPHSSQYDPGFYELVKNELVGQLLKGETQDFMKAAKKMAQFYQPKADVTTERKQAVEEYKTQAQRRNQASESSAERGTSQPSDKEELVRKTQAGDRNALYARLQASGN